MSYSKKTWTTGEVINANSLNNIENGIKSNSEAIKNKADINHTHNEYVTETELTSKKYATETYVTNKIAEANLSGGDGSVDLNGYVTEDELAEAIADIGSGLNSTAKGLLITILRNAIYTSNQSSTITALETALGTEAHVHSYTITVTQQPTCTNTGIQTHTCICGASYTTPILATGHSYVNGTCSVCGDVSDSGETTQTYAITNNLTNVTTNNSSTSINENVSYSATLTINDGYVLETVSVVMGGTDITSTAYADGNITIASVVGDIVITASAIAETSAELLTPYRTDKNTGIHMMDYAGFKVSTNTSLYKNNELLALDVSEYVGKTLRITATQNVIDKGDANGLAKYATFTNGLIKDTNNVEIQLEDMATLTTLSKVQDSALVVESFNVSVVHLKRNTIDKVVPNGAKYLYVNNFTNYGEASIELLVSEVM